MENILEEHPSNPPDYQPVRKGGERNSDGDAGERLHLQHSTLGA
jgi:hypothetical protein